MSARIAVFCVGNMLMLDDGVGPAVYKELERYGFGGQVDVFDVGCMSLDYLDAVRDYGVIVTVDAVDGTGEAPGTLFRYDPADAAPRAAGTQSLHDLKLSDLFQAAALLGYEAQGVCLGMQVLNPSPSQLTVGLTEQVANALPNLVDLVLATLYDLGVNIVDKATGLQVTPGHHHTTRNND